MLFFRDMMNFSLSFFSLQLAVVLAYFAYFVWDFSQAKLKRLPDLEKLLLSVHALGSKRRSTEHPDSRARIFDADKVVE